MLSGEMGFFTAGSDCFANDPNPSHQGTSGRAGPKAVSAIGASAYGSRIREPARARNRGHKCSLGAPPIIINR